MWGFRMSAKYKLYRFMCKEEFDNTSVDNCFSWNSKAKFFTDDFSFLIKRVKDGKFNNSKFKPEKYVHLVVYEIVDTHNKLIRVSDKELMLCRKDAPMVSVVSISKFDNKQRKEITQIFIDACVDDVVEELHNSQLPNENYTKAEIKELFNEYQVQAL